jgi:hypothetical protein
LVYSDRKRLRFAPPNSKPQPLAASIVTAPLKIM